MIFVVSCISFPLDIVVLFDGSDSVPDEYFRHITDFVASMAETLPIGRNSEVQLGVVQYGATTETIFDFHNSRKIAKSDLAGRILSLKPIEGRADTEGALVSVRESFSSPQWGARANSEHVVILLSASKQSAQSSAEGNALRATGVTILAVGVSANANFSQLQAITGDPNRVFMAHTHKELSQELLEKLYVKLCDQHGRKMKSSF